MPHAPAIDPDAPDGGVTPGNCGATSIESMSAQNCVRRNDGARSAWRRMPRRARVGDNGAHNGPQLLGLTGVSQIVAGANHTCALVGTGVWCWGEGYTNAPSQINFAGGQVSEISAGSYHDCAIMMDGAVRCWGLNAYGQLGNNSTTTSATPVEAVVCP